MRTLSLLALAALFPATASAATRTVCTSGCEFSDLESAFDGANPGDVIEAERRDWTLSGELYADAALTLRPDPSTTGALRVIGDPELLEFLLWVDRGGSVLIEDVDFIGSGFYSAIDDFGAVELVRCTLSGADSHNGAVFVSPSSSLVLRDTLVFDNIGRSGAGGVTVFGGTADLFGSEVFDNTNTGTQTDDAGGISVTWGAVVRLKRTDVYGNVGRAGGAVVGGYDGRGELRMTRSHITGNHATHQGGGYAVYHPDALVGVWMESTVEGNTSSGGYPECYDADGSATWCTY